MPLKLNLPYEIDKYKEYYGSNLEQMPKLISDDRIPMTFAQIMDRKLYTRIQSQELKDAWWLNYFDTCDGIAIHPDGRIKIIPDSEFAKKITPERSRYKGGLTLSNTEYRAFEGREFTKKEKEKYATGEPLTLKQILENPIWLTLAGENKDRLKEYAVAHILEEKVEMMKIEISDPRTMPTFRIWLVGRSLKDEGARANKGIENKGGRLIGVNYEGSR